MSIKDNLDKYLKNLNYQIQVESMGLNSWGDVKPRQQNRQYELPSTEKLLNNSKERENKQLARQEQIQLYLEKEKRPITINGVEYKYNNLPEPGLEDTDIFEQDIKDTNNDLITGEKNLKAVIINIIKTQKELENLEKEDKNSLEKSVSDYTLRKEQILKIRISKEKKQVEMKEKIKELDKRIKFIRSRTVDIQTEEEKKDLVTSLEKLGKIEPVFKTVTNQINEIDDTINEIDLEIDRIIIDIKTLDREILYAKNILKDLYSDKDNLEIEIDNKKDFLRISTEKYKKADNENKKVISDYADELRRLNSGSFNVDKLGNETDEEYLKRLTINSQVPFDNSTTKTLSDIERNKEFKENLKSLFQSEAYIEQILNHFKTTNDHFIFIFNQYFNLFKDDYLKIFGYDNKSILDNPEEFIDLVQNFCQAGDDGKPELITPSKEIEQRQNLTSNDLVLSKLSKLENIIDPMKNLTYQQKIDEYTRLEQEPELTQQEQSFFQEFKSEQTLEQKIINNIFSRDDDDKVLVLINNKKKKYIRYFNSEFTEGDIVKRDDMGDIVEIIKTKKFNNKKPPIVLMSSTGKLGTYKELSNKKSVSPSIFKDLLVDGLGLDAKEIQKLYNQPNTIILKPEGTKKILDLLQLEPTIIQGNPELINPNAPKVDLFPKLGYGIKDETPEYVEFGKHILLLKKLFLKNILSLHKKNHQKIAGFKNYNVSNEFVNLIMKILKKENISTSDIANLKIGEKELLDNLLALCELNKKIITGSGVDSISKIKEQLKLIEGQIEAGNNNPVMKDELYKSLFKLVNFGAISEKQARTHYKNICNDFFN